MTFVGKSNRIAIIMSKLVLRNAKNTTNRSKIFKVFKCADLTVYFCFCSHRFRLSKNFRNDSRFLIVDILEYFGLQGGASNNIWKDLGLLYLAAVLSQNVRFAKEFRNSI